ncbi:hypothetical protein NSA47_05765 [Irregularibacter muris]|uniref:Uncharacterized protein n=1 Tax=Irregularibacter muris TaxID=1796619 RepID=A0AAE3HDM8_9FIRM|nr:hypothetical protein [Irregularibacter muris]MCR1898497.1 hypothetical protein [Irregularibacter muris]
MFKKVLSMLLVTMSIMVIATTGVSAMITEKNIDGLQDAIEKINPEYIEEYKSLTENEKEKEKELSRIQNEYPQGSILNERDSAFILLDGQDVKKNQIRAGSSSKSFSVDKTQYNTTVHLYGTMTQNIAYVAGSSRFGGTANLYRMSGSLSKVKLEIFHTAYGLIGSSAPYVGVLYNGSVSATKTSNLNLSKMDKTKDYGSILPMYTTMYARATVTTGTGDQYTVSSDSWKRAQ